MDSRVKRVVEAFKGLGYTDQFVPDHWNSNWRDKRWFGFEDPTDRILQVVTANVYTRIVLVESDLKEPFAFMQYTSERSPGRPKTDFFSDPSPTAIGKSLEEILRLIPELETLVLEKEAA